MHAIRLMKKARQCELKSIIEAKLYYLLISPTDEYHAVSLVSRKDLALVTFGHRIVPQLRAFLQITHNYQQLN